MVVMNEKRRIELRIRGSHGPPDAEEQARTILISCCNEKSQASHRSNGEHRQPTGGINRSQVMAEVSITKYGPHG
jgi:hypothetical protein